MSKEMSAFKVTKPVSVWNKPLKLDFKDFFKSLTNATGHFVTGNWFSLAEDAAGVFSAVGFEKDTSQLAWVLIRKSLTYAIYNLVSENMDYIDKGELAEKKVLETLDFSFEKYELTIDHTFFDSPSQLEILDYIRPSFEKWLAESGLTELQAKSVSSRLPSYFTFALHNEWRKSHDLYAPIKNAVDTPFTRATEHEQGWLSYNALLKKQIAQPIFGETFCLEDVYVPLRASYDKRVGEKGLFKDFDRQDGDQPKVVRAVVDLEAELDKWFDKPNQRDAIRLITGGPGCGKSSFAKIYAAKRALENGNKTLFIPLHLIDVTASLADAIVEFLNTSDYLLLDPFDKKTGNSRILLILDGLDELAMQGKIGAEVSRQFIEKVIRLVDSLNLNELSIQVIITGRELSIQTNEDRFSKQGQVLYMLPYFLHEDKIKKHQFYDPNNLLQQDQRDIWWQKYSEIKQLGYHEMPQELARYDLHEVTSQPLLNYLIALSFSRKKLNFDENININSIYYDLIDAVYERGYETGRHKTIESITKEHFLRVLEEIGLAAWHGNERTTSVREIQEHCKQSGIIQLLEKFQDGAKEGITNLLAAFYFRQCGHREISAEKAFEFTHKSFREYLAVRRIVRALSRITKELINREKHFDSGWDVSEALKHWIDITGPSAIDRYLSAFLHNELSLLNKEEVLLFQKYIISLIIHSLSHGMPVELVQPRPGFNEEEFISNNAEESLIVALHACASKTGQVSVISWPSDESADILVNRLRNRGIYSSQALKSLGMLDLTNCSLTAANMILSDLSCSRLDGACMDYSNLSACNLKNASLKNVSLWYSSLVGTDINGADLEGVSLGFSNISHVHCQGVNLRNANLENANLINCSFENANLENANFKGARLKNVNLKGSNIKGAIGIPKRVIKKLENEHA